MDFLQPLTITAILLFFLSFISNKLNIFSIPIFIIGGVILKPLINDNYQSIYILAQLGLLLLLFYIGFEISPIRYLKNFRKILTDGMLDLLISLVTPLIVLMAISKDFKLSLFSAALLYISSSAIDLKLIVDFRFAIYSFAEKAINILLFQDIIISLLIILLPLFFVEFKSSTLFLSISHIFIFSIFLSALYLILKFTRDILNRLSDETIILMAFTSMILASFISHKLINSEVLGAFMAGSIIKAMGYRLDLKKAFSIIKDIFSPFFFFYFGMNINYESLSTSYLFVIFAILLSIITKYAVSLILYSEKSKSRFRNLLFGLLTIRGEFSIVLAAVSTQYLDTTSNAIISTISALIIFVNMILGLTTIKLNHKQLIGG